MPKSKPYTANPEAHQHIREAQIALGQMDALNHHHQCMGDATRKLQTIAQGEECEPLTADEAHTISYAVGAAINFSIAGHEVYRQQRTHLQQCVELNTGDALSTLLEIANDIHQLFDLIPEWQAQEKQDIAERLKVNFHWLHDQAVDVQPAMRHQSSEGQQGQDE